MKRFLKNGVEKDKLTAFDTPLECERYLLYLGAEVITVDTTKRYRIGNLNFGIDREYNCIYLYEELPELIAKMLDIAGFERLYGHFHLITSLEMLTYIVAFLTKQSNPKQYYYDTIKQMKTRTLLECQKMFESFSLDASFFNEFDRATIPFLQEDFQTSRFIHDALFQTTGMYEKDGACCMIFSYRRYDEPNKLYSFQIGPYGMDFTIMFGGPYYDAHEQIYHYLRPGNEEIIYFPPNKNSEGNIKLNVTNNAIKINGQVREATSSDYDYFKKLQKDYCNSKGAPML